MKFKMSFLEIMAVIQMTACIFVGIDFYHDENKDAVLFVGITFTWCLNYLLKKYIDPTNDKE